jgi:hypothetical protein
MEISEIMYDLKEGSDTDREWIEVYNNTNAPIDFSNWKFFEDKTNHNLKLIQGEKNIPAQGYAIIVQNSDEFKKDWPKFDGTIFDSTFLLNNDGETIGLRDDNLNTIGKDIFYQKSQGGAGDGNSLQKISSVWSGTKPTPGSANEINSASSESSTNSSPSSSTTSSSGGGGGAIYSTDNNKNPSLTPKHNIPEKPRIKAKIISQKSVIVGVPINLKLEITGYSGEILTQGKFYWNLGDGMSKEYLKNEDIQYTYENPGQYIISFEYSLNYYKDEPDTTAEFIINVLEPKILISSISLDGSVTIQNNGEDQINLSNWILKSNENEFVFPKNSIILAGKKIIFPSKVTKFTSLTTTAEIFLPSRIIAAIYPNLNLITEDKTLELPKQAQGKKSKTAKAIIPPLFPQETLPLRSNLDGAKQEKFAESALTANAFNTKSLLNATGLDLPSIVFVILLITSASVIYFINQKRIINKNGDEFKILEE